METIKQDCEKKIVLIGGGGHCKSVIDTLLRNREYKEVVITDPALEIGSDVLGVLVVGTDDILAELLKKGFQYAFITVGSIEPNDIRYNLATKAKRIGYEFPIIIDSSAIISEKVNIGEGTFIGKNSIINAGGNIGKHCIINTSAIIEHDDCVGDFSHISVGSVLCGNVSIGNNTLIGARATVIQGVSIGKNTIIGAGAVVNKNMPDNCSAVGAPAKIIRCQNLN